MSQRRLYKWQKCYYLNILQVISYCTGVPWVSVLRIMLITILRCWFLSGLRYWYYNSLTWLSTLFGNYSACIFDYIKLSLWFDDEWNCSYCRVNFNIWFIAAELLTPDEMYTGRMIHAHPKIRNTTYKKKYRGLLLESVIFETTSTLQLIHLKLPKNFVSAVAIVLAAHIITLCCTK